MSQRFAQQEADAEEVGDSLSGASTASSEAAAKLLLERRSGEDRRGQPTRIWDSLFGRKLRKHGRREGESENTYVDVYRRRDVGLILGILLLNILDAFFTLRWLDMGGGEANPIMDQLLEHGGDFAFLVQKCLVVGLWLVVLIVHKNFRIARVGLLSLFAIYGLLLLYHFVLQTSGVPPTAH